MHPIVADGFRRFLDALIQEVFVFAFRLAENPIDPGVRRLANPDADALEVLAANVLDDALHPIVAARGPRRP